MSSRPMPANSVLDGWTTGYRSQGSEVHRRARRTAGAVLISVIAYSVAIVISLATEQSLNAVPVCIAAIASMACGIALKANIKISFVANTLVAVSAALLFGMLLATGGESVGFLIGMPIVPTFAMLVGDRRSALIWSGITFAVIVAVAVLSWLDVTFPIQPDPSRVAIAKFYATIVVVATIIGIFNSFWNDRASAEQALRETRDREKEYSEKLRVAAHTAKLGHWSFDDTDAKYLSVSEEYADIFGYTAEEFLNRYWTIERDIELVHPDDRKMVNEAYNSHTKLHAEYRILRADGCVRTVIETFGNEPDLRDGHVIYDGTLQDITELRQVEVELRAAKEAAEAANRAKSQFLANMSHELRTPLTTIIGYSELLQDQSDDHDQEATIADLKRINSAGLHLLSLITDVLDLSKIEAGKTDMQITRFSIKDLVDGVAATFSQMIAKNGNTLDIDCPADIGAMNSDMTKMRQILFNLLSNAAKFTADGRIQVNVRRDAVGGDEFIVLEVHDSGIGISDEQAQTVFDAFTQVENSTESGEPGTGLGLTITREYCRLLGGSLELSSTPGSGSVFTATLRADMSGVPSFDGQGIPDARNNEGAENQSR